MKFREPPHPSLESKPIKRSKPGDWEEFRDWKEYHHENCALGP